MVELNDIFKVASGVDEQGLARSGAGIVVTKTENGEVKTKTPVYLDVPVKIISNGGCVVLQADFLPKDYSNFKRTVRACREWKPEEQEELFVSVVPLFFEAQLTILFSGFTFFDFYENKKNRRVIMAFDNTATEIYGGENIDYNKLKAEVRKELNDMLTAIDEQIDRAEMEQEAINQQIQDEFMPDLLAEDEEVEDIEDQKNPGIRIVKDDDDENKGV